MSIGYLTLEVFADDPSILEDDLTSYDGLVLEITAHAPVSSSNLAAIIGAIQMSGKPVIGYVSSDISGPIVDIAFVCDTLYWSPECELTFDEMPSIHSVQMLLASQGKAHVTEALLANSPIISDQLDDWGLAIPTSNIQDAYLSAERAVGQTEAAIRNYLATPVENHI